MSDFKFDRVVFLGAGDDSRRWVQQIHERVDQAIELLGGLQQPLPPTQEETPAHQAEDEECEQALPKATREIVRALTGKEIDFKVETK